MKPGYVYAVQPEGMALVKIGCTISPRGRIEALASFSPMPVTFRHLLEVSCFRAARIFEAALLGWTHGCMAHGEWRNDLDLVDDWFGCVTPAVDVRDQFSMIERRPAKRRFQSQERMDDLLAVAEASELLTAAFQPEHGHRANIKACEALGMPWTSTPVTKVIADRARAYLAAAQGAA